MENLTRKRKEGCYFVDRNKMEKICGKGGFSLHLFFQLWYNLDTHKNIKSFSYEKPPSAIAIGGKSVDIPKWLRGLIANEIADGKSGVGSNPTINEKMRIIGCLLFGRKRPHLHHWFNGRTSAFQAESKGSIPLWCFCPD